MVVCFHVMEMQIVALSEGHKGLLSKRPEVPRFSLVDTDRMAGLPTNIEVRDSWTGYLAPGHDGLEAWPDWESCWHGVVAVTVAISWKFDSKIHQFGHLQRNPELGTIQSDPSRQVSIEFSDAGQS